MYFLLINNNTKTLQRKKFVLYILLFLNFVIYIFLTHKQIVIYNKLSKLFNDSISYNFLSTNKSSIIKENDYINNNYERCYYSSDNLNIKLNHLIITRFMMEKLGVKVDISPNQIYEKKYIYNGIRVMKKYLLPSLENQSCKKFIFIIMLGNKANKTFIESLVKFNNSFELKIIYQKDIKNYIRKINKGFDVLITTRIDYDDRIYYDAVNDVRKAININKPMILYGYNHGLYFYEFENKYYEFYKHYYYNGTMSIFLSLIVVLNKVNDTYTIYDLKRHIDIRNTLFHFFTSFGIKNLDYEPAIFDHGGAKFVWVRHNFSGTLNYSIKEKKELKEVSFNISKFYGK